MLNKMMYEIFESKRSHNKLCIFLQNHSLLHNLSQLSTNLFSFLQPQTATPPSTAAKHNGGWGALRGGVHSMEKESTRKAYRGKRQAARPLKIRPGSPSRRPIKAPMVSMSFGLGTHPFQEASPDRKLHPLNRKDFSKSCLPPWIALAHSQSAQ